MGGTAMSNNKVYCKNCEHFDNFTRVCNVLSTRNSTITEPYMNHKGYVVHAMKDIDLKDYNIWELGLLSFSCLFNKKYNCKYYKRKWYKFWVKNV